MGKRSDVLQNFLGGPPSTLIRVLLVVRDSLLTLINILPLTTLGAYAYITFKQKQGTNIPSRPSLIATDLLRP